MIMLMFKLYSTHFQNSVLFCNIPRACLLIITENVVTKLHLHVIYMRDLRKWKTLGVLGREYVYLIQVWYRTLLHNGMSIH